MKKLIMGKRCFWRFKGDKTWTEAWPQQETCGLIKMGNYNGSIFGPIVSLNEIDIKQED
jgi:hypothetical protein